MTVSAHYQQADIGIGRDRQNGALDIVPVGGQPLDTRLDAASRELTDNLVRGPFACMPRSSLTAITVTAWRGQERQRVTQRAGGQPASVPGDPDVARIERSLVDIGDHQHRSARIEENPCGMRLS